MTETTTVRELIAKLSALPPDMLVFLEDDELGYVYENIEPDITWVRRNVQFGDMSTTPTRSARAANSASWTSWADGEISHNNPLPHVDTNSLTLVDLLEHFD